MLTPRAARQLAFCQHLRPYGVRADWRVLWHWTIENQIDTVLQLWRFDYPCAREGERVAQLEVWGSAMGSGPPVP